MWSMEEALSNGHTTEKKLEAVVPEADPQAIVSLLLDGCGVSMLVCPGASLGDRKGVTQASSPHSTRPSPQHPITQSLPTPTYSIL